MKILLPLLMLSVIAFSTFSMAHFSKKLDNIAFNKSMSDELTYSGSDTIVINKVHYQAGKIHEMIALAKTHHPKIHITEIKALIVISTDQDKRINKGRFIMLTREFAKGDLNESIRALSGRKITMARIIEDRRFT
jgi:hypothetical protein